MAKGKVIEMEKVIESAEVAEEQAPDNGFTFSIYTADVKLPDDQVLMRAKAKHEVLGDVLIVFDSETLNRVNTYSTSLAIARGIPQSITPTDRAVQYFVDQGNDAVTARKMAEAYYASERASIQSEAFFAAMLYYTKVKGVVPPIESSEFDADEREEAGLPPALARNYNNPIEKKMAAINAMMMSDPVFEKLLARTIEKAMQGLMEKAAQGETDEDGFRGK